MNITADMKNELYVGDQTLREFYIEARKKSGLSISAVQTLAIISHPTLWTVEHRKPKDGPFNHAVRPILIALMALGYEIKIEKPE